MLDHQVGGPVLLLIKLTYIGPKDQKLSPEDSIQLLTAQPTLHDRRHQLPGHLHHGRISSSSLHPVMSSPGLLFLLLVSSCLSVLSAPPDQETPCRDKFRTFFKKHDRDIAQFTINTIEQVPVFGRPLAAVIKNIMLLTPKTDAVESKLKELSAKLCAIQEQFKLETWAAGPYQKVLNDMKKAWITYTMLMHGYQQMTDTEKEARKTEFVTYYSQYVDNTLVLYLFLTATSGPVTQNLGDLLADKLRCHEKEVKAQFLDLNKVMCESTMLSEMYYGFKGIPIDASINKFASQSAQALMRSHQRCISDSAAYIKKDVFELIDDTKEHQQIANNIRNFLAETYDRYDWEVVAFTTHNSKHTVNLINKHNLLGFTEVERGTVTVAVAKQVKGGATRIADVQQAIKNCLRGICLDVIKKLQQCQETVFGKPLYQTYTAAHAYKKKDEDSAPNPHVFTGNCGKGLEKYRILIKSDEEIMGVDPCSKQNCGRNGKCVIVPDTFIAMCECVYPHYGEHCEMSFESYKRDLQNSMSASPANRRAQPSGSRSFTVVDRRRSRPDALQRGRGIW